MQSQFTPEDIDRFWSRVDRRGPDECWPWKAGKTAQGYGQFYYWLPRAPGQRTRRSRPILAHRFACIITHGPLPDGYFACHHCDNRPCCNPAHLFVGTCLDNALDMVRKGRMGDSRIPSEQHPKAKLTNDQVREIRRRHAEGATLYRMAKDYGMAETTLGALVKRQTWRDVE